jgi:apolipoprotein N-acyltransferase
MLFEWIRSFLFTGFPWNQIGSMLAFSDNALQLSSIIGTYGLTLLVIIISCSPAIYYKSKDQDYLVASTLLLATIFGYGYIRLYEMSPEKSDTTIRIVQPSIPQTMKWDLASLEANFREYIDLSISEPLDNVDMVIWGETATPFQLDMQPEYLQEITAAVPDNGVLVTGLVRIEFDAFGSYQPLNSMFVINKQGEIVNYYDKVHLVPFGEYIPLREYLPDWIRPVANAIGNFKKGEQHKVISHGNIPAFGASICYEIIFPSEILDKNNRPEWLINLTNDGWYGDSAGPRQHLISTRLRAIEEGITIVRVANSGISAIISPYGTVIESIGLNEKGILDIALPKTGNIPTPYSNFGNMIPLILCLANILIAFVSSKKH